MTSQYVKSLAIAAFAALGILPVLAQAQLIDLGVATGYAINNSGQAALSTGNQWATKQSLTEGSRGSS